MNYRRLCKSELVRWTAAGVFSVGCVISVWAQGATQIGPPAGAGPPPNINPKREDQARQVSNARLRSAEMDADVEAENRKHIQAAITHMKDDFVRIQVLRNDIARNLVAHKPLDYNLITEQTTEINKRAHRLNVYMLARADDEKEPANAADSKSEEMTESLVRLCKLIDRFTENPALKNAATVEAKDVEKTKENKAQADKDLLSIIKLSDSIQKQADSLKSHH
ncbi:MAG TPA: hypothetical protein VGN86_01615 [Pyrinomonadaceae bacterium]|jgi:hypothetical protein|nr:hypothetical protein [Pyrinomonadaceae bacterium]